ncbi:MAG: hypothetical protein AB8G05_09630 [Oligoflexales bacterium]
MQLHIDFDIEAITEDLDLLSDKALDRAVVYATNKALAAVYSVAVQDLKKRYGMRLGQATRTIHKGLPPSANKLPESRGGLPPSRGGLPPSANKLPQSRGMMPSVRPYLEAKKYKVRDLRYGKEARLNAEIEQISTIHFVVGDRNPQDQGMIPRSKRKPSYVKVRKGRKTRLKGKFIGKPSRNKGGTQVFRYGDFNGKKNILLKDSLPNVYSVLNRDYVSKEMVKAAETAFEAYFADKLITEIESAKS